MTESRNTGEALSPKEVLRIAEKHICRALEALEERIRRLEEEGEEDMAALSRALGDARKAVQAFFDERTRFEKYSGEIAGGAGGLDLEAAREEVWRRLSCLVEARGAGGVSGGAE